MTLSKLTGQPCEHRVTTDSTYDSVRRVLVQIRICHECGAWLSLGPSNDAPPEVQVEMRAAVLDAMYETARRWDELDGAELAGVITFNFDSAKQPEQDGEWAGYLAAAIASHKEQP